MIKKTRFFIFLILFFAAVLRVWAGPPFLTDDPEPVDYQHFEFYIFQTLNESLGSVAIQGPALEFNWGALPEVQLHIVVPLTGISGSVFNVYGLGDTELGVKFCFVDETSGFPMIGIFPMAEIPTGNPNNGLGNGLTWYKFPLWIQKSWGPWTTYGGGGYALNIAAGMRSYPFGGWLLQRNLSEWLTLGGEFFAQGQDRDTDQGFVTMNIGGQFNFSSNFSLLFSGGHSIAGQDTTIEYLALYWTWGPKKRKDD